MYKYKYEFIKNKFKFLNKLKNKNTRFILFQKQL